MTAAPGPRALGDGATGRAIPNPAEFVPLGFVVVAEAAWISVLAGFIQEFLLREPSLDIPGLVAFVVFGVAAARLLGRRLGWSWPLIGLALVLLAAVAGSLAAPAARAALDDGPGAAIATNPGGWMAGLAVLRGFAHARLPLAEGTVARLLGLGVPGIAGLAIVGGVIVDPYRSRFLADTLVAAVVFVGAAFVALTLARLGEIGRGSGFDWRRNPTWLGLTIGVMTIAVAAAVPLAAVAGRAIEALIAIALGPLLVVGLTMGLDRTARRLIGFVIVAAVVVYVIATLFATSGAAPAAPASGVTAPSQTSAADQLMTVGLAGLALLVTIVAILVLTAVWMRRTRPADDDLVEETRTIDRGSESPRPTRRRRPLLRRADPARAAGAYVALVEDLAGHPAVRRADVETPAEHAARLRAGGIRELSLDLLAADYALARYGGVALSEREDRRAVDRWRLLRKRLIRGRR